MKSTGNTRAEKKLITLILKASEQIQIVGSCWSLLLLKELKVFFSDFLKYFHTSSFCAFILWLLPREQPQ